MEDIVENNSNLLAELEEARWQLRVEAVLDRIRRRVTEMNASSELLDIVSTMSEEFSGLGLETVQFTYCRRMPDHFMVSATKVGGSKTQFEHTWPFEGNPIETEIRAWLAGEEPVAVFEYSPELAAAHMEFIKTRTNFFELDPDSESSTRSRVEIDGFVLIFARTASGAITNITWKTPSRKSLDVLIKYARAFDLAYTRFEDLQLAEAQTREAQIEAALERVRAHAMGMQSSDDIGRTTLRLFEEIQKLCPSVLRIGLAIMDEKDSFDIWLAGRGRDGESTIIKGNIVHRGERPEADEMMNAWVDGRSYSFRESIDFLSYAREFVFNDPNLVVIPGDPALEQHLTTFSHKTGFLFVIAGEPFFADQGEGSVVQRFAGVFDLAYQRYRDLAKAELDYTALLKEKARTETALSELQTTQKQLVEQEKLASLGALTAGIAHEIKNPLNFVNNFAEVSAELMDELAEAVASGDAGETKALLADLRGNAEQIARHGKRADSIVRSMMQHARGGASKLETVDINTYLEEYIGLAWHGMRARNENFQIEVVREFADNAGSLDVLPQELGRVILNLLNNAFDALKGQSEGTVTVATSRENNRVTITASDNGPGIPVDIREKIFEPFFTTKATGQGTGLGLSLSHDIIAKGHRGTLSVRDSSDGGAEFVIVLPASS